MKKPAPFPVINGENTQSWEELYTRDEQGRVRFADSDMRLTKNSEQAEMRVEMLLLEMELTNHHVEMSSIMKDGNQFTLLIDPNDSEAVTELPQAITRILGDNSLPSTPEAYPGKEEGEPHMLVMQVSPRTSLLLEAIAEKYQENEQESGLGR